MNIQIVHHLPGRTRVRIGKLNGKVEEIEARCRSFPGIKAASFSPLSGTVLLYHDGPDLLKETIILLDYLAGICQQKDEERKDSFGLSETSKGLKLIFGAYMIEKMGLKSFSNVAPWSYLTPTAIATLYAARGLLKDGFKTILKPTPDSLTAVALVASILKGSPRSALIIYCMTAISEGLSEYTMKRTRKYVRDMMTLDVHSAWLIAEDGQVVKVGADKIQVGDHIKVFQGEKIPFDGNLTAGNAAVDQSSITGEYMPVNVRAGSFVYAGSIVVEGELVFKVSSVGKDLTVNRMIQLIEEGEARQAPIQMASERFTEKVAPISLGLACGIYMLTGDWNKVLNMLVIDYVCGVKLSAATAISATIGRAARRGILLKGGQTIERLADVDTVILDKTGTITKGELGVEHVMAFNGFSKDEILTIAASAEQHSPHPIAEGIREKAAERGLSLLPYDNGSFESVIGKGVKVKFGGKEVLVGSRSFLNDHGVLLSSDMKMGIFVAKENTLMGIIILEDKIRTGINRMIARLKKAGVREVIMLTGDYEETAKRVSSVLSIDRYIAEALPKDKVEFVRRMKEEGGRTIMMVGDGINDAPALSHADIGITLGAKKTDIAMETADIVIHSENPLLIAEAVEVSKQAMKTIKQNLAATMIINTGAIGLGVFGIIKPVTGAAVHNASTLVLVLNSARLIMTGGGPNERKAGHTALHTRKSPFVYPAIVRNQ